MIVQIDELVDSIHIYNFVDDTSISLWINKDFLVYFPKKQSPSFDATFLRTIDEIL